MQYQLNKNDIHIWQASLHWPRQKINDALCLLSEEEQARAKRFVMDIHRENYITSHAILREVLSYYLRCSPQDLQFRRNSHGKPYLSELLGDVNLQFNMSDSQQVAMYAITLGREVGIDVEFMKPDVHVMEIAERFFSPKEYEQLLLLPAADRLQGFYRCWTRKEAYIKAIGQGLSFPLSRFTVSLQPEKWDCLLEVDGRTDLVRPWKLFSIQSVVGYQAALAIEGEVGEVKYMNI